MAGARRGRKKDPRRGGDPFSLRKEKIPGGLIEDAHRALVQVGPPVQLFLDRRDGTHFLIEGVKLVHRARGETGRETGRRPVQNLVTGSGQILSLGN
jgi:hypothetical protein